MERKKAVLEDCLALEHKKKLHVFFPELAAKANLKSPEQFASQLQILMERTMAMVQLTGDVSLMKVASHSVRTLLATAEK